MQTTAATHPSLVQRASSCPELRRPDDAHAPRLDSFVRALKAPRPLCTREAFSEISGDCSEARRKHDHFDLRGGMARGAALAQGVGMTLTLSGLLGGWPVAVVGAGIITATVLFCLARYLLARGGKAGAAQRKIEAAALEKHLTPLVARLDDKDTVKQADPEDLDRARLACRTLEETLAMLRGGPWYVTKRLVSSTIIGPLVVGLETVGSAAKRACQAAFKGSEDGLKRSEGESR